MAYDNKISKEIIFPERGLIYDRNGRVLAENIVVYTLELNRNKVDIDNFKKLTGIEYSQDKAINEISREEAIEIKSLNLDGVEIREVSRRSYPYKEIMAHILGYVGMATSEDMKLDKTLDYNEKLGKNGVEAYYNDLLKGIKGEIYVERNALSKIVDEYSSSRVDAVNGNNLILTIDIDFQKKLYSKIKEYSEKYRTKGGAGIIQDVNTGEILAMVSYPSYDNNLFVDGISSKEYTKLIEDSRSPLLNRAIAAQLPPGSTFKIIVGAAGLETGSITPSTEFYSSGVIKLSGGMSFQEYARKSYGSLNIKEALMVSSNIFFCRTMLRMKIEKFIAYADKFGVGKYTGIDIFGEAKGRMPSPENKIWLAENGATWLEPIWYPEGDSCNSAIGQGITLTTPIQLVNITSSIANGGTVYRPRLLLKYVHNGREIIMENEIKEKNFIKDTNLNIIREGMRASVIGGRGISTSLRHLPVSVAAKTGTAEFGKKDKYGYDQTHAWVVGFFPYEKPKYSFVILLEGGGSSSRASFLIRDFIRSIY